MKKEGQTTQLVNRESKYKPRSAQPDRRVASCWQSSQGATPVTHTTVTATPSSPLSPALLVCVTLTECLLSR